MTPVQRKQLEADICEMPWGSASALATLAALDEFDSLTARVKELEVRLAREIQSHGISVKTQMELGARMVAAEARLAEVSRLCREVATGSTLSDFAWIIQRAAEGRQ